ncbi:hypothetical protein GGX14DRAFT_628658 [Mycena pura]|uniref:CipC protein n=1 Tax=Mycena pura TaxID=153505 RepID=A0AAD6YRG6_9AGAR|nr:hypothetical protein GGX14DRAFT_628658 [Mycena pura]
MGLFDDDSTQAQQHEQLKTHTGDLSHELLAGAAAFAASREYEKHVEKNGKPVSHADAKSLLAGFAAAFIDHEVETRGLDAFDKEKAKREAAKQTHEAVAGDYE